MDTSRIIAVVAARGGSKRLPRKNVRRLAGVPLIGWSLAAARAAGLAEVYLSTEDREIADLGRDLGFKVPYIRPPELATDAVPAVYAVLHLLDYLRDTHGIEADVVVLLPPTAPFRSPSLVRDGLRRLQATPALDRIVSAARLHVPASALYQEADGIAQPAFLPVDNRRLLMPTGALFAARVSVLRKSPSFLGDNVGLVEHSGLSTTDIDTPQDWLLAKTVVAAGLARLPQPT